ncbi:MAG: hypothetical protein IKW83_01950 [Muribaculaceae bacterium]|nr:hypothetical protein [Muribaculaceae bacterium]
MNNLVFELFLMILQRLHEDTTLFGNSHNVSQNFNKINPNPHGDGNIKQQKFLLFDITAERRKGCGVGRKKRLHHGGRKRL